MSPVEMHDGEVRYYSSPVMVKTQQYTATLTSERLIIEGGSAPREFKVTNIVTAEPAILEKGEPGLKLVVSTPSGQKEMLWSFPVGEAFRSGEQQAWVDQIRKASGEKPFVVPAEQPAAVSRAVPSAAVQSPVYSPGEMEILQTAGVRIKRSYYTLYLTNLRLILQNSAGQTGREFAIAELMDVAKMESESGEPSIALTVGSQTGVKQMILTFPSQGSREAWMTQISAKIPAHVVQTPVPQPGASQSAAPPVMLTLQPGERTLISSPGVRVKRDVFTAYLTNTRFVLMTSSTGMMSVAGEFALNTLRKVMRIASELAEPGISLSIVSRDGEKEMHLIFPSMDLREMWMEKFEEIIPREQPAAYATPAAQQYTVTTVTPPARGNAPVKFCTVCGARNHPDDRFCAMCGQPMGEGTAAGAARVTEPVPDLYGGRSDDGYADEPPRRRAKPEKRKSRSRRPARDEYDDVPEERRAGSRKERPPKRRKEPKAKRPYEGGMFGFLTRPADAYAYYNHESPGEAIVTFIVSGLLWAVISVVLLAFVVPKVLNLSAAEFPILGALQGNMMAVVMLIVVMLILWIVLVLIQAVIVGVLAKVFGEDAGIGEVVAVVMRSTLPYAVIGWIPGFGILLAGLWSMVATMKGLDASLNMRGGSAIGAAVLGFIVIAALLLVVGLI